MLYFLSIELNWKKLVIHSNALEFNLSNDNFFWSLYKIKLYSITKWKKLDKISWNTHIVQNGIECSFFSVNIDLMSCCGLITVRSIDNFHLDKQQTYDYYIFACSRKYPFAYDDQPNRRHIGSLQPLIVSSHFSFSLTSVQWWAVAWSCFKIV